MSEFIDYITEIFRDFGPVTFRKMFGGHGVFHDGLMIGLLADDELFLKVDAISKPNFERHGLEPFTYSKGTKLVRMSYHRAPEDSLEDPAVMREWAQRAFDAALRTAKR